MNNFENILTASEKSLNNIGIFDKNNIEEKLKDLEQTLLSENFWKNKNLVKKLLNKKNL